MANAQVGTFYRRLIAILGIGIAIAIALIAFRPAGEGSVNVAAAIAGIAAAVIAQAVVLFVVLAFMRRVATVIASTGGPADMSRYDRLRLILGGGIVLALLIGFLTNMELALATTGRILIGAAVALIMGAVVLVAFLWFIRNLVKQSSLRDAPSVSTMYMRLLLLLGLGAVAAILILSVLEPGPGPVSLGSTAVAVLIAEAGAIATTFGLLLMLGTTVDKVEAASASTPPKASAQAPPERGTATDPGVVYVHHLASSTEGKDVIDVEGIGETYSERLREKLEIYTFGQLYHADAQLVATAIGTTKQQVRDWQAMIHLTDIKGIGPQYAEMLLLAGIRNPKQLAAADATELLATIDAIEARRSKQRVLKVNVEAGRVAAFIAQAQAYVDGKN